MGDRDGCGGEGLLLDPFAKDFKGGEEPSVLIVESGDKCAQD